MYVSINSRHTDQEEGLKRALMHDSVVQTEDAIDYFLEGKNFYTENYHEKLLGLWHNGVIKVNGREIENPALYHYAYLPLGVIISTPFYLISKFIFDFYDQRIINILSILVLFFLLYKLFLNKERYIWFIAILFNPLVNFYWIWGINDPLVLLFIILSLWLLRQKRYSWATISYALAFAIKQTAWFLLPFYFMYILFKKKENYKYLIKQFLLFFVIIFLIIGPFLLWDAAAFIDDTILYLSGSSDTSYPIRGLGFGGLIYDNGLVGMFDYFPFFIFQAIFGLPVLIFLLARQKSKNNISTLVLSYGLFLFVIWLFSRYFTITHILFIIQLLVIGVFLRLDELEQKKVTYKKLVKQVNQQVDKPLSG